MVEVTVTTVVPPGTVVIASSVVSVTVLTVMISAVVSKSVEVEVTVAVVRLVV